MKKFLTLLFVVACFYANAQSSYCPPNIDFELGNLNYWTCNVGTCATGTGNNPTVLTYPATPTGPNAVQHIVRSSGTDTYGGFPVLNPISGNNYSLQLGDTLGTAGYVCAQAKYAVHVPAGLNNFSLTYYYAVVLEDGSHTIIDQPNFRVKVFDSSNNANVVQCASYTFVQPTGTSLPGFYLSTKGFGVHYKPWTPSTINLNNLGGHTVYVQFDVSDCGQGGHWGYAYIDFGSACQLPVVIQGYCPGSSTAALIGPSGYQTYRWYDSLFFYHPNIGTLLDTNQTYNITNAPHYTKQYTLVIVPYQGWGCPDTMKTFLTAQPPPNANFGFPDHYCAGSLIHFRDSSTTPTPGTSIVKWKWDFGDPSAGPGNANTDTTQNPTHVYNNLGTYTACLIATSSIACVSDTQCYQIHIDRLQPPLPILTTLDTLCGPTDSAIISSSVIPITGFTYTWNFAGGKVVSGNINSTGPIVVKWGSAGHKYVSLTAAPPIGDDTDCWTHNQIDIFVKGIYPSVFLTGTSAICLHQRDTINLSGRPATCGATSVVCPTPTTYNIGTNNSTASCTSTGCLPTPFRGFYTESKLQFLYLASELQAAGFQGGPISEIDFNVLTKNSSQGTATGCNGNGQFAGFTIQMACVPYNNIYTGGTASFDRTTPLTTVYSTSTYNTTLGMNSFPFQTAYNWDGVSNLLVQTCYDAGTSCFTSDDQVAKSAVTSGLNLCVQAYSDAYSGCDTCYGNGTYTGNCGPAASAFTDRPDFIFKGCSGNVPTSTVFTWTSTPVGFHSNQQSPIVSPSVTTTYHLKADDNTCITYDSFTVNVLTVNTVDAGRDTLVCPGTTVRLMGKATGPVPLAPVPCGINSTGGCSSPQSTAQVGNGNVSQSTYSPFNNSYNNGRVLMRYSAVSLIAALGSGPKIINAIQFNVLNKQSFFPYSGITIKMSCIPSYTATWATGSVNFPASGVVVYGPTNSFSTVAGWNNIPLANSYNWDGISDLLVEICFSSTFLSNLDIIQGTTTANNMVLYAGNGSTPPAGAGCNIISGQTSNVLPNIKLKYCNFPINPGYNYIWVANPPSPTLFVTPHGDTSATPLVTPFVTTTFTLHLLGTTSCPVTDTIVVYTTAAFGSVHNLPTSKCVGDTVNLFANSTNPLDSIVKWKWSSSRGNIISCDTCAKPSINITGTDTVYAIIYTKTGCAVLDTIYLDTLPRPSANFVINKTQLCSGEQTLIHYTGAGLGASNISYLWKFDTLSSSSFGGVNQKYDSMNVSWINTGTGPVVKNISLQTIQNGCKSYVTVKQDTIHIIPKAKITASDTVFCAGVNITVNSTGSVTENPNNANYIWSSSQLPSTPKTIAGQGPNTLTFLLPNVSTAKINEYLQIVENGCKSNVDSAVLTVHPIPYAGFASAPNPSCSGDRVYFTFTGTLDSSGHSTAHQAVWAFTNGNPSSAITTTGDTTSSVFYNTSPTAQNNLVSVTVTQSTCQSAPFKMLVVVNPNPNPVITGPRDVCYGETSYLSTTVAYKNYNWTDVYGIITHNDTLPIKQNETVHVDIVDYNNCKGSAFATVTIHPLPTADAGKGDTIFLGNSVMLDGSNSIGGDTYNWSPSSTLSNSNVMQPIATPSSTTSYVLCYSNSAVGCKDFDTVVIAVKDCKPLMIPNAFTPFNNDGIDDYFMVLNPDDYYKLVRMEIYNRWGQLIYSTNDKHNKGWDGTYAGQQQPEGVYIYNVVAECGGGKLLQLKGDVTLIH